MSSLRLALDGMAAEERTLYERRIRAFADNQNQVRRGFLLVVGLNLFLVTLGGIILNQESRRRRHEAAEAKERNVQLARAVTERTAELTGLSHYLQRLQDEEKAKLAREIHDELGGTLAAAKIDLQLLSDKLAGGDPQRARLARIMAAIDETIQVKRRIIEDLRPTLLDNLGIGRRAQVAVRPVQQALEHALSCRDAGREPSAFSGLQHRVLSHCAGVADEHQQVRTGEERGGLTATRR